MRHKLSKREYSELHKISSSKRATAEIIRDLKRDMANDIRKEDEWWSKAAAKFNLDPATHTFRIDHETNEIVAEERKAPLQAVPKQEPVQEGTRLRERAPSMNSMLSQEEIDAIKASREETK